MVNKKEKLSIQEARKLVLLSQRIPPIKQHKNPLDSTLYAIEHLGYIQIDTISVIQRAHHHTLWNRNPKYSISHLDDLMTNKQIFEYWSHAAAYLPIKDFRFSLPRKHAIATEKENHWYKRDESLMKMVLKRISNEGPLMSKDFDNKGDKFGEWQTKPAKQALELLFMQGELMISHRNNFHKVYDLTERILPNTINTSTPSSNEYARFIITRYLKANGIGQALQIAYLLKNTKPLVSKTLQEMILNGELIQITIKDSVYYTLPSTLQLLNTPLKINKLKILSPFDNLLIQRKRTKELFNFDYLLECYVPAAKRKFGYFTLPILWNGKLAARMDCKADRKTSTLNIYQLSIEPWLNITAAFVNAFQKELIPFSQFNNCTKIVLHKTLPSSIKFELQQKINR
ncbi:winged helix-turn-helix domain-containing protein [Lutibacter citreus]|uniref:winged helix-turn-helix domain-containing protein n=1 Tax=Lutibacter citreus TaxID=2138210 RepID=UPI000DBE4B45|nr:crosslink repair DNA glycosylase YcaQ family protein [Lutibacter citreus]